MNLKLAGFGAEPKKLAMLGGLVLVAAYFLISNRSSSDSSGSVSTSSRPGAASESSASSQRGRLKRPQKPGGSSQYEFRPSLKFKEGQLDRATVDPTLRLDLLEKVQNVKVENVNRSLFEALSAPPVVAGIQEPAKIIPQFEYFGPPPPPKPAPKPPEPPPPAIPLKFYGFINPARSASDKRAFFLDGDDIIVANEGQLVKNRYKIVRIGVNSADVEDTQFKNHRQTLPLVAEEQSS